MKTEVITETPNCNLCGSNSITTVYEDLSVCNKCGLGFLSPRMNADGYSKYYALEYDKSPFRCTVPEELKRTFLERVSKFINCNEVLDFGAGGGEYLSLMNGNKTALEPSVEMSRILRSKGINTINGLDLSDKFDFVILRHTLEHLLDPGKILSEIRDVMRDGSAMYVAVPNSIPVNRGYEWLRVAHTYYFSTYTLISILCKNGFQIETIGSDRREIWCIARPGDRVVVNTPSWLPEHQVECFNKALMYRSNRIFRIKEKAKNLFYSL